MSSLPTNLEPAIFRELLSKYPRRGILLFKLLEGNKSNDSFLDEGLQAMVISYVSALNNPYPNISNMEMFTSDSSGNGIVKLGGSKDKPKAVKKLTPIWAFLKKLTLTPEQVKKADVEPIFAAGWSEREFLDLVCLCSVVNCINRLAIGAEIDRELSMG